MSTGPQLRTQRLLAGVRAADLAARMGVGRTRIPQIEGQASVSEDTVTRYLRALVELSAAKGTS